MNKIYSILEGLHVNEAVNQKLLDRFIAYCKASSVKNIGFHKERDTYYLYNISDKRLRDLANSFIRTNAEKGENIIFEYDTDGTTKIIRLEHKI